MRRIDAEKIAYRCAYDTVYKAVFSVIFERMVAGENDPDDAASRVEQTARESARQAAEWALQDIGRFSSSYTDDHADDDHADNE